MKKIIGLLILVYLISCSDSPNNQSKKIQNSTKKQISLAEIWDDTFAEDRMHSLNSMNDDYYTLLNSTQNSNSIDKYSYKTLEKVATLVDDNVLNGFADSIISSYSFNNDETKLLLGSNFQKIYRRSYKGNYYAYDMQSKRVDLVDKNIQEPVFSPDNKKIAYVKNNNLFIKNTANNSVIQVTSDGVKNHVINGLSDWVYEEEFGFVRAFEWSNNSEFIAYLKFDESQVPEFSMDMYGDDLYPTQHRFKYPKAGQKNASVSLFIYNTVTNKSKRVELGTYEYLPRIKSSSEDDIFIVTTLNRHQNDLRLFKVNANKSTAILLLNETDKAYVDVHDNLTFLDDHSFIWTSEKDGYNHLYHYNKDGELINQITKGKWEVTNYYGYHKQEHTIYFQSVENGSINRGIYSIGIDGSNKKLLSPKTGTSNAAFSKNLNYFINTYSNSTTPSIYTLHKSDGTLLKTIKDNKELKELVKNYDMSAKEFSTINIQGNDLNMWMIKPSNFDSNKKYPMLMYQYSGPGSQQVANKWNVSNDYWYQLLAQQGYIIVCVDGRGTGYKGSDFKKSTYLNLVKYETEDQIAAAKQLATRPYIDEQHVGIWGWSFGGTMSTNCLLKGNDIFTMAIAVAPVTNWRFYDSLYTERFLRTPEENAAGYDDNSPINYADKLKGKYLLIHGSGDDNVHVQNTMRMSNALIQSNKPFEQFIYPDKTHGIYKGKNTRLHLYTKMTKFINDNLNNN